MGSYQVENDSLKEVHSSFFHNFVLNTTGTANFHLNIRI